MGNAAADTITFTGTVAGTNPLVFEGVTVNDFETTFTITDPTADRMITFPNVTGTVITSGDTGTVTSTMILDGTIVNADISNTAAIANSKLAAPNAYYSVQAHKSSVGASQTDVEIFEFTAPTALTLTGVQVYVTSVTANGSVDVKEAGVSLLSSSVDVDLGGANTVLTGIISDASIASGAAVSIHVTTDGTGAMSDLTVTLIFKAAHTN